LEDLGPLTPVMELSTVPRLILKFTMLFVVNISAVLSNVTSNSLLDSTYNIKQRELQKSRLMLRNIRQLFKSKLSSTRFSNLMTWTIKILPGMNTD
jgi:hypothetical protein